MYIQLARTSPYLTGQFKLNMGLSMDNEKCFINKLDSGVLSPSLESNLTREIPFSNYSIAENIKMVYNTLGGAFFEDVSNINPEKILYSKTWKDTYDHTYQSGLKRIQYSKYNKQFSLLCPVWFDDINELINSKFKFTIKGKNAKIETTVTVAEFSEDVKHSLLEYGKEVDDNFININLDRNSVFIKGLHVPSGTVITKDVSYVINSIFDREKTILETDSILSQLISTNNIIPLQALNLNFVFNLSDIMPKYSLEEMLYNQWNIKVDIINDDNIIPFKDLYTNYYRIPSYVTDKLGGHFDKTKNSLDYLLDNKCIDTIFVNRTTQPVFHWSLKDDPTNIFNLYRGLSCIYSENNKDTIVNTTHISTPNPFIKEYNISYNNLNWCKIKDISGFNNKGTLIQTMVLDDNFTSFEIEPDKTQWVNNMKFVYNTNMLSSYRNINIILYDTFTDSDKNQLSIQDINDSKPYIFKHTDTTDITYSILIKENSKESLDSCVLWSILNKKLSSSVINTPQQIMYAKDIEDLIYNYEHPWKVVFNKSIKAIKCNGPKDISEIEYYKYSGDTVLMYRYFGSIIPMFIDINEEFFTNDDYWVKLVDDNFLLSDYGKKYNNYLNSGYMPEYPSIGFWPLEHKESSYVVDTDRYPEYSEYCWYKDSCAWLLPETIKFSLVVNSNVTVDKDYIYNSLGYYLLENGVDILAFDYIRSLYSYNVYYDYYSETDITMMKYDLTFDLK